MSDHDRTLRESLLHRAVLAGDEAAWRALYDESFDSLQRYVEWRTAGLRDRADEVLQETWMTAVKRIRSFEPQRGGFLQWLRGIAANVLRNQLRRENFRRTTSELLDHEPSSNGSAAKAMEDHERRLAIAAALAALPEHYEDVLRLKYVDGCSMADIAASRGDTVKAVESLLSRAREAFRREWQEGER